MKGKKAPPGFDFFATNNTINDVSQNGIEFESYTYNFGSSLKLSVDISDNSVYGTGSDGKEVHTHAFSGGFTDASDPVTINRNTISDTGYNGVELRVAVYTGGTILHTASINDNTIDENDSRGIGFEVHAENDANINLYVGTINPTLGTAAGNLVNDNDAEGAYSNIETADDAFVDAAFRFTDSEFSRNGDDGFYLKTDANEDSTISTDVHFVGVIAYDNYEDGIEFYNDEDGDGVADMKAHFRDTTVTYNGDDGVHMYNDGSGATQFVSFGQGGNVVTGNTTLDIDIVNSGGTQTVNLTGVTYGTCDSTGGTNIIPGAGAGCP